MSGPCNDPKCGACNGYGSKKALTVPEGGSNRADRRQMARRSKARRGW